MRIAVDSKTQGVEATGKSKAVREWIDGPTGRTRSDEQARDPETGMWLWDLEIEYDEINFGEEETAHAWVQVGHEEKPQPKKHSPITFKGLTVDVRLNRKSGQLTQRWNAEAIDRMASASSTAPAAASESKAA